MGIGNVRLGAPALILLSGVPGVGKTTFARALGARLPLQHIESDALRRRLFAHPRYTSWEHRSVFAAVERELTGTLGGGRIALVDATNLRHAHRQRFFKIAERHGAVTVSVRLVAPDAVVRERLRGPREGFSQADERVYELLRGGEEPFRTPVVVVDTRFALEPALRLVERLLAG